MSGWQNEAHVDRLRVLWPKGHSCSQIAATLNREFRDAAYSRNAVIGKIHRLGLEKRHPASGPRPYTGWNHGRSGAGALAKAKARTSGAGATPAPKPKAVRVPKAPTPVKVGGNGMAFDAGQPPTPFYTPRTKAFAPLSGSSPVIWTSRAFGQCAWPVGGEGADTLSCALSCDGPYCIQHTAIMTSPRPPKAKGPNELIRSLRRYA